MFLKKLQIGAVVGVVLGILATIGSISQGDPVRQSLAMVPTGILMGIIAVFWFTRNMDEGGNEQMTQTTVDITKLQNDLRVAVQNAAYNDSKGDVSRAAYWHSQAAVLQSQLRSFGA